MASKGTAKSFAESVKALPPDSDLNWNTGDMIPEGVDSVGNYLILYLTIKTVDGATEQIAARIPFESTGDIDLLQQELEKIRLLIA